MAHKVFEGVQFMRDLRRAYEADSQQETDAMKDKEVTDKVEVIAKKLKDSGLEDYVGAVNKMMADPKGKLALELVAGTLTEDELKELGLSHVSFKLVRNEATPVSNLHPTQNEIGFPNSLSFPIANKFGSMENAMKGDSIIINKTPIITCKGSMIIDGHHRWSQVACVNPEATMVALDLQIASGASEGVRDFKDASMVLKVTQSLIAALTLKAGETKLPSASSGKLDNLYTMSEKDLFDRIKNFDGSHEGLEILAGAKKVKSGNFDKDATIKKLGDEVDETWEDNDADVMAAVYLTANCKKLPKPAQGATDRVYMPQTDGSKSAPISQKDLIDAAKDGINIKESKRRNILRSLRHDERVQGSRVSPRDFDDMCRRYADRNMESISDMRSILSKLERDVVDAGGELHFEILNGNDGAPHYAECELRELLKRINLYDNDYVSLDFIDGEAGDQYALVFHNYENDEDEELCATLVADFD